MLSCAFIRLLALASSVSAGVVRKEVPTITLDEGTFRGVSQGPINAFLGIPYAKPPVGDLRFRRPEATDPYQGSFDAAAYGPSCIQQNGTVSPSSNVNPVAATLLGVFKTGINQLTDSEDCLFVNVITPANATANSKLPVVFWIYGGGFVDGSSTITNGTAVVERSLQLNEPVMYVSVNYRLSALGFPGSKEVREAGIGNLGLRDQRLGMRWVQKYIESFGGDPSKVTIWGESAGAISVALHMLTNGGNPEGLFRAGFMNSGSPHPTGQLEQVQHYFDQFATDAGCASSLGSTAVFDCLRAVSEADIRRALDASPHIFSYSSVQGPWGPHVDGDFLRDYPANLVLQDSVAKVPFVTGDCDDEGTLFALSNSNITTDTQQSKYLSEFFFRGISQGDLDDILAQYPRDPIFGSPFGTGLKNAITPQFKRMAALLGDVTFQVPRRFFLSQRSDKQDTYSFVTKRGKSTPVLGAFHSSDLANIFGPGDMTDYLIRFAAHLNPNGDATTSSMQWPKYTVQNPKLMTFLDGHTPRELTDDTYRAKAFELVTKFWLAHPGLDN